ncbi:hypothetical protein [Nocardia carnea]|uniref:Uncharacterized protein n=1 Tax=Nocardia carnea TaxID=37328 RepID=A0ABW7TNM6_9NOCA|nr:hypothetical protein [Nocardia carnea]
MNDVPERLQLSEVHSILREVGSADAVTMSRIASGLRDQIARAPRLQDEIDGVVARYRAAQTDARPRCYGPTESTGT